MTHLPQTPLPKTLRVQLGGTSLPHVVCIHPEPQSALKHTHTRASHFTPTHDSRSYRTAQYPRPNNSLRTSTAKRSRTRTLAHSKLAAAMSDAYERERQNNSRLDELSAKVSALRGVTIDIYDNARDQGVIDSTVRHPSSTLLRLHTLPSTRSFVYTLLHRAPSAVAR